MLQFFTARPFIIGSIGFLLGVLVTLGAVWLAFFKKYGWR